MLAGMSCMELLSLSTITLGNTTQKYTVSSMGRMYLRTDNIHPAEEGQTSSHSSLRSWFRLIWVNFHMINAVFSAVFDTAHGASPPKHDLQRQKTLFPKQWPPQMNTWPPQTKESPQPVGHSSFRALYQKTVELLLPPGKQFPHSHHAAELKYNYRHIH